MNRRVTVRGIIIRDGKIFAVRHRRPDGYSKDFWCTPGGGLEENENLADGVRREILEETGVDAQIDRLVIVYQFHKPKEAPFPEVECLEFFFLIKDSPAFDAIDLTATTHGEAEIHEAGFIDPTAVDFRPAFIQSMDLHELLTKNSPVVITSEF